MSVVRILRIRVVRLSRGVRRNDVSYSYSNVGTLATLSSKWYETSLS